MARSDGLSQGFWLHRSDGRYRLILKNGRTEQAQCATREKFRRFVEQSGDGIALIDCQGIIVEWNQALVDSTGIPREETLGQPIWLVHSWMIRFKNQCETAAWIETSREQILEALRTGDAPWLDRKLERKVVHHDGSQRIFEITVFPIETSRGRMLGSVGRDITERRKNSEELDRLQTHLEEMVGQRMAALQTVNEELIALAHVKDEFVSNVSHELRTPITSLKLHQHLLRQHPEELVERLDIMGRETDRLAATIEQLLQLSRLDQGRIDLAQDKVDLNRLVSKYVSDRAPLSQATRLDFEAGPDLPPVMGDESLLGEVLGIFLTNAINYTPAGGRITVRTCARCSNGQRVAGFGVSDNGPGIGPAEHARLFDRFFRGKAGRESSAAGSGLGLAIAREIVNRHCGAIEVESSGRPGEGATFMVWLPAKGE